MTHLPTTKIRENLSDVLRRVSEDKERIVLTEAGKEIVAVIPLEDLALVEALEDRADLEEARASLKEARATGTISLAALKRDLGL
jgi:prevent-host-death family protein